MPTILHLEKSPLHILFLSSWFPNRTHSTLGNFVERHAESVALLHDVTVLHIVFDANNASLFEIEEEQKRRVRRVTVYCKPGIFKWLIKYKGFKTGLRHLDTSGKKKFDIIHHNVIWKDGWQALLLRKWWKIPLVITEHWTGYDPVRRKEQSMLLRQFSALVARKANLICPVSHDLKNKMIQFGLKGKYAVVPNVVDTNLFTPGVRDATCLNFLHVSHLKDSHKNISGILRVWKKASDQNKQIHLNIGGDGDYQAWEKEAIRLQIDPNSIRFFGEQSAASIAEKMTVSHCLLMFSNYENLPVVIVEALAAGMFVVSSNVGGISEHVNKDRGILVAAGDETQLLEAILRIAKHEVSVNREEIRQYALEHFSEISIASRFSEEYQKLL